MIIKQTEIEGAFLIEPQLHPDERGFVEPAWSEQRLHEHGIKVRFVEGIVSHNLRRGTLRGLHYQAAPHGQAKLVRCTRGRVFDVGVDLRRDSPTYLKWVGYELSEENRLMLYLPGDFAHGYLTLEDKSEVYYLVSSPYAEASGRGARWNDPAFGIDWRDPSTGAAWREAGQLIINERDRTYPDFQP